MRVATSQEYLEAMLEAIRPGTEEVLAFYDHRIGVRAGLCARRRGRSRRI